jgi:hypothetical protein
MSNRVDDFLRLTALIVELGVLPAAPDGNCQEVVFGFVRPQQKGTHISLGSSDYWNCLRRIRSAEVIGRTCLRFELAYTNKRHA